MIKARFKNKIITFQTMNLNYAYDINQFLIDNTEEDEFKEKWLTQFSDLERSPDPKFLDDFLRQVQLIHEQDPEITHSLFVRQNYFVLEDVFGQDLQQLRLFIQHLNHQIGVEYVESNFVSGIYETVERRSRHIDELIHKSKFWIADFVIRQVSKTYDGQINFDLLQQYVAIGSNAWWAGVVSTLDSNERTYVRSDTRLNEHKVKLYDSSDWPIFMLDIAFQFCQGYYCSGAAPVDEISTQFQKIAEIFTRLTEFEFYEDNKRSMYESTLNTLSRICGQNWPGETVIDYYLDTLLKILENKEHINIEEIECFNNSYFEVFESAEWEHSWQRDPFKAFCDDVKELSKYAPQHFSKTVEELKNIYVLGLKYSDLATVVMQNFVLDQARLERESIESFLQEYIKEDLAHRAQFGRPLPFYRMKNSKFWYTDLVTAIVMKSLDYQDTSDYRQFIHEYFISDNFTEILGERDTVIYNDIGAFMGDKSVVALEQLYTIAQEKGIKKIVMRIIEPAPGLREIAYWKLHDCLAHLQDRFGHSHVDVEIRRVEEGDFDDLEHYPMIEAKDALNMYVGQNLTINYPENEAESNISALPAKDDFVWISYEPTVKDVQDYKGQSVIGEKMFERKGAKEGDLHRWYKNEIRGHPL